MPKVSIIMPAYNAEKYIGASIESVLEQSYKNWELIIVNDDSKDATPEIINQYAKKDKRLVVTKNTTNQGIAKTKNKAIKLARGQFISFLDNDDCWYSNKLEKQIQVLEETSYPFVFSSYDKMDADGKKIKSKVRVSGKYDYKKMLRANYIGALTAIYSVEALGKFYFDDRFVIEDYVYWLQLLKETNFAFAINEPLAIYRVHADSFSRSRWKVVRSNYDVYRRSEKLPVTKALFYSMYHIATKLLTDS